MRRLTSLVLWTLAASACRPAEPGPTAAAAQPSSAKTAPTTGDQRTVREALLKAIRPIALKNCTLKRFGSVNDGGYLMCENLIGPVVATYSYGIDTEDNWGCEVSTKYHVPVHQYDCFTPYRPACEGGRPVFHSECIADRQKIEDSYPYDTLAHHIAKNHDVGKRVLVKMDVEGAEWDSLLATPDTVLERIDQLPMELHGIDDDRYVEVVRKLKRTFYLVSVHFNNWSCTPDADPFPSRAYQVLFVNKRLGMPDPSAPPRRSGSPPDAPDSPDKPDCQIQP